MSREALNFQKRTVALMKGAIVAAVLAWALPSGAELGGEPSRMKPNGQSFMRSGGLANRAAPSSYTTQVQQLDTGTIVNEYITTAGVVFAVSWEGPVLPDLSVLMGSHFNSFRAKADASRTKRNIGTPLHIDDGSLVVHSAGHQRAFFGSAYVPALVPSGLNIRDVLP